MKQTFRKKFISFSCLESFYNRLANKKQLILSQEEYFTTLKEMVIGTVRT